MEDLPPDGREVPEGIALPDHPQYPSFTDEKKFKDLIKKTRSHCLWYYNEYEDDNKTLEKKVWSIADWMYKCGKDPTELNTTVKDSDTTDLSKTTNTDPTEADTGSTLFFSTVRTLATQIASVLFSEEEPFKYKPAKSGFHGFASLAEGEDIATQYNRLARKTMELDDFEVRAIEFLYQLIKYGNVPAYVYWKFRTATRRERMPIREPDPETNEMRVVGYEFVDERKIVDNRPCLTFLAPENFYADRLIPDLNDQHCILVRSIKSYAALYSEQQDGNYENVDQVNNSHLWHGDDKTDMHDYRVRHSGTGELDDSDTGQYEVWDIFTRIPVDDRGKWDAKKNEWQWHWVTIVGGVESGVVVRFTRNPDPDDEPPFKMIHALPDDPSELYHFGYSQALESNFREETTAKNQMIDSKTIQLRRPLLAVEGEVFNDDLRYETGKVYDVETPNSLREMDVNSAVFDCQTVLQSIEEDSKRAAGTLNPVMGEALGGRTSASEAMNVFNQALQPGMVMVRYVLHQLLPWYGRKIYRLWQMYSLPEQVMEITHEDQIYEIKPAHLWGEFDINIDVVDRYIENQAAQQNMDYILQSVAGIPGAAERIDWEKFLVELMRRYKFSKNPAQFIKPDQSWEAMKLAKAENELIQQGIYVPVEPGQNHPVHIQEHKNLKVAAQALTDEEAPWKVLLDQQIAEHEQAMASQQQAMAGQQQAITSMNPNLPGELSQAAQGAAVPQ